MPTRPSAGPASTARSRPASTLGTAAAVAATVVLAAVLLVPLLLPHVGGATSPGQGATLQPQVGGAGALQATSVLDMTQRPDLTDKIVFTVDSDRRHVLARRDLRPLERSGLDAHRRSLLAARVRRHPAAVARRSGRPGFRHGGAAVPHRDRVRRGDLRGAQRGVHRHRSSGAPAGRRHPHLRAARAGIHLHRHEPPSAAEHRAAAFGGHRGPRCRPPPVRLASRHHRSGAGGSAAGHRRRSDRSTTRSSPSRHGWASGSSTRWMLRWRPRTWTWSTTSCSRPSRAGASRSPRPWWSWPGPTASLLGW